MLANRVREFTLTTGTGDLTLSGALPGHVAFADGFAVGDTVAYVIEDGDNYEIGTGTLAAADTLVRATVTETLVGGVRDVSDPTPISLSGNARVFCAATAELLLNPDVVTDSISELTPETGVIIDGVRLKDGGGTFTDTVVAQGGATPFDAMVAQDTMPGTIPAHWQKQPTHYILQAGGVGDLATFDLENLRLSVAGEVNASGAITAGGVDAFANAQAHIGLDAGKHQVVFDQSDGATSPTLYLRHALDSMPGVIRYPAAGLIVRDAAGNEALSFDASRNGTVGGNFSVNGGLTAKAPFSVERANGNRSIVATDSGVLVWNPDSIGGELTWDTGRAIVKSATGYAFSLQAGPTEFLRGQTDGSAEFRGKIGVGGAVDTGTAMVNVTSPTATMVRFDRTQDANIDDLFNIFVSHDGASASDFMAFGVGSGALRVYGDNHIRAMADAMVEGSLTVDGGATINQGPGEQLALLRDPNYARLLIGRTIDDGWDIQDAFEELLFRQVLDGTPTPWLTVGTDLSATFAAAITTAGNISMSHGSSPLLQLTDTTTNNRCFIQASDTGLNFSLDAYNLVGSSKMSWTVGGSERMSLGRAAVINTGGLVVRGGQVVTLAVGSDASTGYGLTDNSTKVGRVATPHYTNAEEPMAILVSSSDGTDNTLSMGGGSSLINSATKLNFYTASNDTTPAGTLRLDIDDTRIRSTLSNIIEYSAGETNLIINNTGSSDSAVRFRESGITKAMVGWDRSAQLFKLSNSNFGGSDALTVDMSTFAATFSGALNVGGDTNLSGNKLAGVSEILRGEINDNLNISASNTAGKGLNFVMYGEDAGDNSNDLYIRSDSTNILHWDDSGEIWSFLNNNVNGVSSISRGNSSNTMYLSGGTNTGLGGNIILYGESEGTYANDIWLRSGTSNRLVWDNSASRWDYQATQVYNVSDITSASGVFKRTNNTGFTAISGGDAINAGASMLLYGPDHLTNSNQIIVRSGSTVLIQWDDAGGFWNYGGTDVVGVGKLTVDGGAKFSLMNKTDGGSTHGLFYWDTDTSAYGAYMATSGTGKSLSDGVACASLDGRASFHIRDRVISAANTGFIWENNSEHCLMSLTADTGDLYTLGGVHIGGKLNYGTPTALTVAAGTITVSRSRHIIDGEGDLADDLETINGGSVGDTIILSIANNSRPITFRNTTGNMRLASDFIATSVYDRLTLEWDGVWWCEVARSSNS